MSTLGNTINGTAVVPLARDTMEVAKATATSSSQLTNSYAKLAGNVTYNNVFRMGLWNESGTLIGSSDTYTVLAGSAASFREFTWTTKPNIVSGTTYYVGLISYNNTTYARRANSYWYYDTSVTLGGIVGMSLLTPTNFNPALLAEKYNWLCGYVVHGGTGPSLKIEGITPGKLEYTSWSQISTVR